MVFKILLTTLSLHICLGQLILKFENPITYTLPANSTDTPLGFTKGLVPHPPDYDRFNTVIQLSGLSDKYIKVWVETIDRGASMCFKDDDSGPRACDQGQIVECYAPSSDSLKVEFYCGDSCQSSDVYFWYRVHISPEAANDQWCADVPDDYPSDLRPAPPKFPPTRSTPKAPPKPPQESGTSTLLSSALFTVFIMVVSKFMN